MTRDAKAVASRLAHLVAFQIADEVRDHGLQLFRLDCIDDLPYKPASIVSMRHEAGKIVLISSLDAGRLAAAPQSRAQAYYIGRAMAGWQRERASVLGGHSTLVIGLSFDFTLILRKLRPHVAPSTKDICLHMQHIHYHCPLSPTTLPWHCI